jgi:hypothetical protein
MYALDARIGIQQRKHFLREQSPARAGHTYSDDFFAVFVHVAAADKFQSPSGFVASQAAEYVHRGDRIL